jgi:lipopolysaccharide transport system permease protein
MQQADAIVAPLRLPRPGANPLSAPFAAVRTAATHRALIGRLARREIEARYRGAVLGVVWAVAAPLMLLCVYTFVFSTVFRGRWRAGSETTGEFALLLFSGLLVFSVFADCVNRAPGLMLENPSYIKRVIFPLEILPWVALLSALFNLAVGTAVLTPFYAVVFGAPPVTVLLLPVVLVPLVLVALGLSWFLASVGVFLRDIRQVVPIATQMLIFLSPVFYPLQAVPPPYDRLILANPLTTVLENSKAVLFWGSLPNWSTYLVSVAAGFLTMGAGYWWFLRTRKAFGDVV